MEYAIVDIETTGSYAGGNGITEIAILVHNGQHVIEKFQTLVNPYQPIPYHIQVLTGISDEMVENAPSFHEIAPRILELLEKRIFVAHNVNFDYSFIFQGLKLAGFNWKAPKLCTVRLARKIIPNLASYSLGKLCQNLGITIQDRHRALGDAQATVILFEKLLQEDKDGLILSTLKKTKEHRLPTHIDEADFLKLPESVGIYLFRNKPGEIIYVGKAINIKKRVLSHFTGNNVTLRRQAFINEICSIDFEESGTELMALLMECQMIKKHWPSHNSALKKYEPKFCLIQYEDQKGYFRLLVSKFSKNTAAVQYFERASDANQLLLQLIELFDLDTKICSFYSTAPEIKHKITYENLPSIEEYNDRVQQAIDYVNGKKSTFLLMDQGRHLDEKSYVYYKNNTLHAFGFIDASNQAAQMEDLIAEQDRCVSNYYMTSLVLQYAERFPGKVITNLD
ncbi:exonuclease domain-containing protein [Sphingobacterium pedocola]|uniref:DNA polymerase III subunit epsilon n=1 Tax=Sphingobacterium pedocola TaxID=2082722 RepID=A0ABR9T7I1_9SPHI|nr:exonuclease domain-containing protein [Sphingobacterium pedocola]MBE8721308.1 DNA polymerase III subunit epsilon [Sphingobacterium pedocola]